MVIRVRNAEGIALSRTGWQGKGARQAEPLHSPYKRGDTEQTGAAGRVTYPRTQAEADAGCAPAETLQTVLAKRAAELVPEERLVTPAPPVLRARNVHRTVLSRSSSLCPRGRRRGKDVYSVRFVFLSPTNSKNLKRLRLWLKMGDNFRLFNRCGPQRLNPKTSGCDLVR